MRKQITKLSVGIGILFACLSSFGAVGVTIAPTGSEVWIDFPGLGTNGTYSFGKVQNLPSQGVNLPGSTNIFGGSPGFILSGTRDGYAADLSVKAYPFKVYGTDAKGDPAALTAATKAETNTTDGVRVVLMLSKEVYSNETWTATGLAGLYAQGGSNSPNFSVTATNLSTRAPIRTVGNWGWPGHEIWTNSTATLRFLAYHKSGGPGSGLVESYGNPVAAVQFFIDEIGGTTTNTAIVTGQSIDWTMPDQVRVSEYIATLPLTNFTPGAKLRCNAIAYPWNSTNALLSTFTTGYRKPDWRPTYVTNVYDPNLTNYGLSYAYVVQGSNDANGKIYTAAQWATNAGSRMAFGSHGQAFISGAASNNAWYGRNEAGGLNICTAPSTTWLWLNKSVTLSNPSTARTLIYSEDGSTNTTRFNGFVTDNRATTDGDSLWFKNIGFSTTNSTFAFPAYITFQACDIDTTTSGSFAFIQGQSGAGGNRGEVNLLHCSIKNFGQSGANTVREPSTQNLNVSLVRGNLFIGPVGGIHAGTVIGNLRPTGQTSLWQMTDNVSGQNVALGAFIWAHNEWYGLRGVGDYMLVGNTSGITNGFAIVSQVFECIDTNINSTGYQLCTTLTQDYFGGLTAHNDWLGTKIFWCYVDTGTNATALRQGFASYNDRFSDFNTKHCWFFPQNYTRIGGMSVTYGVDVHGFIDLATTGIGAPESFQREFAGIAGIQWGGTAQATNWIRFEDDKTPKTGSIGAGGGIYKITCASPVVGQKTIPFVRYDNRGRIRGLGPNHGALLGATP